MNLRTLAQALAASAALVWSLPLLLGPSPAWIPFLTPPVVVGLLVVGLVGTLVGLRARPAWAAYAGLTLLGLAGLVASGERVGLLSVLGALAWLGAAESAAASRHVDAGSGAMYLRAAAPFVLAASIVGLATAAALWGARFLPIGVARSLDATSVYAAVVVAAAFTLVALALAWAFQRAPRAAPEVST